MHSIRKHIVTDEANRPVAVQIDYDDWCRIEQYLQRMEDTRPATDLSTHAGRVDWPVDGLAYQRQVRSDWR